MAELTNGQRGELVYPELAHPREARGQFDGSRRFLLSNSTYSDVPIRE